MSCFTSSARRKIVLSEIKTSLMSDRLTTCWLIAIAISPDTFGKKRFVKFLGEWGSELFNNAKHKLSLYLTLRVKVPRSNL